MWPPSSIPWGVQREWCKLASANWAGTSSLKHSNYPGCHGTQEWDEEGGHKLLSLAKKKKKNWCFSLPWPLLIPLGVVFAGQGCRYQEGFCHMETAMGSSPGDSGTGRKHRPQQRRVPRQQIAHFPLQTTAPFTASLGYSQKCWRSIPGLSALLRCSTHKPLAIL